MLMMLVMMMMLMLMTMTFFKVNLDLPLWEPTNIFPSKGDFKLIFSSYGRKDHLREIAGEQS